MMWFAASALAAELMVFHPDGPLRPGEPGRVGVHCAGCGPGWSAEALQVQGARVLAVREALGVVQVELLPAADARVRLTTEVGGARLEAVVAVPALPASGLVVSAPAEAALAEGAVEIVVSGTQLDADRLRVRASEGSVALTRAEGDRLHYRVTLAAERASRTLLVGVLDTRDDRAAASFVSTRLRARYTGTIAAEAGARATLRIGGRSYGPFVAGADGSVALAFDALPGESSYELSVADDLGNTQKLVQPVPAVTGPTLLLVEDVRARVPGLWAAAVDARGAAYTGPPPACRSGGAAPEPATELSKGRWRWSEAHPGPSGADLPVGCSLGEVQRTGRLPAPPPEPEAIALRFYPDVLSADFPLAEVQATLIDARGERLEPDGLELSAGHGALRTQRVGGALRGEYDGTAAAALGEDELRARWSRTPGQGAPARVQVCAARAADDVLAVARVLDADGRPLVGAQARGRLGATELRELPTDARGYARWRLEGGPAPALLRIESGPAAGEAVARFDEPGDPGCIALAAPDRADLDAAVRVPIRTGRVRQVFMETEPRTLTLGPGATARVRVRMLDGAGAPVRDEPVTLQASDGTLATAVADPDGTLVAQYTPGPGADAREVTLTATSSAGTVSTSLSIVPRPVRGFLGAGFGWVGNFGAVSSPYGALTWEHRLPVPGLSLRAGVGVYGVDETVAGDAGSVRTVASFFPLELGASLADRGARFSVGASLSLVLVPYPVEVDFGGGETVSDLGLAPPGVDARGSVGWRLGQTELFAEAGYLLYTLPAGAVSVAGNAGGLHLIVGYRLLY